jgi:2-methylisocitrate lyase-like PEP mutase family enzyme
VTSLRPVLANRDILVCPGVPNALFAKLAAEAGFPAVYTSGAGIANMVLGYPDIGLATMTELLDVNRQVLRTVDLPVIADIDTGYGGIVNVRRTVEEFERAGVAAVQLEDQVNPKRCGHFAGKAVVPKSVMIERVLAAVEARRDPETMIIARTDARQAEGLDAAIRRGQAYVEAGADAIFVEAPQDLDELRAVPGEFDVPALVNMVEGGVTPIIPATELAEMGYRIVLYANALQRLACAAVLRGLSVLQEHGTTSPIVDEMLGWRERQTIVGLPGWQAFEENVLRRADALVGSEDSISSEDREDLE